MPVSFKSIASHMIIENVELHVKALSEAHIKDYTVLQQEKEMEGAKVGNDNVKKN